MQKFLIKYALLLLLASGQPGLAIEVEEQTIRQDQWPQYANGTSLSNLPQIQRVLTLFDENGGVQIVIRYPGGEAGIAWARQLYNWFVAYGVPSAYLSMEPGSGASDQLLLVLVDRG